MKPPFPMFPSFARTLFGRIALAAKDTSREVSTEVGLRFALRLGIAVGHEVVAHVMAMGSRVELEELRKVLPPEQFALAAELYDALHRYRTRASAASATTSNRVSPVN